MLPGPFLKWAAGGDAAGEHGQALPGQGVGVAVDEGPSITHAVHIEDFLKPCTARYGCILMTGMEARRVQDAPPHPTDDGARRRTPVEVSPRTKFKNLKT